VPVPAPTEERRIELVKQSKKYAEEGKVSVRNVRRDVNEHLKKLEKDKKLQEDMFHDALSEVQKMTDKFCADLDKMYHAKEKEIMEV
ncbi:MAG: ribosome recycling factor, partial [candidate division Zixibacteria bacterium]|nr:ribosome recycling factor [candidate division Zixibacteria bacterium]